MKRTPSTFEEFQNLSDILNKILILTLFPIKTIKVSFFKNNNKEEFIGHRNLIRPTFLDG